MPSFGSKPRSWDAYMAGIGASGALMGSAIVLFVIMVGIVTFKTWPHAGSLLGVGGGDVALQDTATPAPGQSGSGSATPNLGGRGPASKGQGAGRHGGRTGIGDGLVPGEGGDVTEPGRTPGGSTPGQPLDVQPPSNTTPSPNVLGQAVSGAGNTAQHTTENLGNTINTATATDLGNVVTGLGNTLNKNLQGLAGNH